MDCLAAQLFLNTCFPDTVTVTLFRTAVETAVSGVPHKLLGTGDDALTLRAPLQLGHLPPNSEGARFISAQLSTDAVSALRKVRVLIRL